MEETLAFFLNFEFSYISARFSKISVSGSKNFFYKGQNFN